jgi:hypothetical protein
MQVKSSVHSRGLSVRVAGSEPIPTARTFISLEPESSAKFFAEYFYGAKRVQLSSCKEGERAVVDVQLSEGTVARYVFIEDKTPPTGDICPGELVPIKEQSWEACMAGKVNGTIWADNHDAFLATTFNRNKALADGVQIRDGPAGIYRVNIPSTLWIIELHPLDELADPQDPLSYLPPDDSSDVAHPIYSYPWLKSTFMTADPPAAVNFSIGVLGALQIDSEFSWPPPAGSTGSLWVSFPESGYQLHFPYSPQFELEGPGVKEFAAAVESARNLEAGVFDGWLYESLVLSVASLVPFMERLNQGAHPFLLAQLCDGEFALFADIPKTGITIQLRSSDAGGAKPWALDMCLETF